MNTCLKLLSLFFLTSLIACESAPGAASLRNGNFFYYAGRPSRKITIVRNDSIQKERDVNSGKVLTMRMKWLTDSLYSLTWEMATPLPGDTSPAAPPITVTEKIHYITKEYYLVSEEKSEKKDTIWIEQKENQL